jgi:hypothetical protein
MTTENQAGLLAYLAEKAHELVLSARTARPAQAAPLMAEAEELMAIRSAIIHRGRLAGADTQLQLPLEVKRAA